MTASLYDHPDLYDLIMTANPAAQAFYGALAREKGASVLVLACGTGRISNALARAGLDVVGLDRAPAMLARARADAAATGARAAFVEGDMRDIALPGDLAGRRFDLVVVPHNSLLHLLELDELLACFASVARVLAPGGALAFDVFTPSVALLAQAGGGRGELARVVHPDRGEVVVEQTSAYDPAAQVLRATWLFSSAEEADFLAVPMTLRQIFPQELALLLARAGFRLDARYGDFDRRPFGPGARHQVCVCTPQAG